MSKMSRAIGSSPLHGRFGPIVAPSMRDGSGSERQGGRNVVAILLVVVLVLAIIYLAKRV
jgi:hypothetical protein